MGGPRVIANTALRVTDHAVLRYLERVRGLDVEAIRQHIAKVCAGPAAMGASAVRAEGVKFCISSTTKTVMTVAPDNQQPSNTQRARVQNGMRLG
jgi:hypothetical protein